MDQVTLKEIVYIVLGAIVFVWKYFKDRRDSKKEKDKEQLQRESAAEKLAEDNKKQAEELAANLKKELDAAAEKLAKVHAEEIRAREAKEREAKEKSSVEFIMNINREVVHETRKVRDRHNAMRCYVMHFSDGTVTDANVHLLKVTFLHEAVVDWTDIRVEALSKFFKEAHMPEMFLHPMYHVIKLDQYYLEDRTTLDLKDVNTRDYSDWMEAYKVNSTLWLPIKTNEGQIVAVLVVHWPVKTDLHGTVIAKIKDINRTIEQIYDKYKPYNI